MKTGIYKIICKKNNKIYIGSSNNIERRWNTHMNTLDKKKNTQESSFTKCMGIIWKR